MFSKILIANRGEIACRVIESAHKMGIRCVAVYSDADENSRHVAMADEAYRLGPAPSKDSYLRADIILDIAKKSGAQAVHPGYGFMSENPEFAQACADNNIVFIGPPVPAIEAMGSKSAAKIIMSKAQVPLVPGYHGDDQSEQKLKSEAEKIGYPVLLKAAFGGGGKGMRVVESAGEFDAALASAKREAMAGFGNDTMLLEKYLTQPRHVEIQVFADNHGNAVYLSERDCSVQRRHQKVIEEAPAPGLTPEISKAMGEAAVRAALAIDYRGAGTVEFLYDVDGSFYFMEMNTRLQVEHPVTEMITGQDLVKWQLQVAANQALPISQDEVTVEGHAFEVRIYAEDPDNDFLPATGKLNYLRQPQTNNHVRVDTGVVENDEVSPFYDPMIAKLIVWDEDRPRAIRRMLNALDDYRISGVKTNLAFLSSILEHPAFQDADLETRFIENHHEALFSPVHAADKQMLALAALFQVLKQQQSAGQLANQSLEPCSPWHMANGFRLNQTASHSIHLRDSDENDHSVKVYQHLNHYDVQVDDVALEVRATLNDDHLNATINGHKMTVRVSETDDHISVFNKQHVSEFTYVRPANLQLDEGEESGNLTAPMNGTIVAVLANPGDKVEKDAGLIVMEAMKMEYTISAPYAGTVAEVFYQPGDLVEDGAQLVELTEAED